MLARSRSRSRSPLPRSLLGAGLLVVLLQLGAARAATVSDPRQDVPRREPARIERVRLVAVLDGDTLDVVRAGRRVRVRLESVDTEERLHASEVPLKGAPQTVFGEETALWLAERLSGISRLGLLLPAGHEERDAHGRLLAHLVLPDGRDLNVLLVRLGYSPYFQRYGPSRVDHDGFVRAQRAARRERLGIWNPRTNRPRSAAAPAARRDYPALLAWWEARAAAVGSFRQARTRDVRGTLAADRPDDLARAARNGEDARVFGEVEGAVELSGGALLVFLRSAPSAPGLRLLVPASRRAALAPLELAERSRPGRQNFLWVEGRVLERDGHWSVTVASPAAVRPAGPEPDGS